MGTRKNPLVVPRSRLPKAIEQAAGRLGIDTLHAEQQHAIEAAVAGHDVLMVLPTGFGKSACYQIPSMLFAKPVVVVSPLRALLRDQQQKLDRFEVPCVRIDGTLRGRARTAALERIGRGEPLLVMTTPETLESEDLHGVLTRTGVGLAAVDEAHCISEWGHDFRPSYSRIGSVLEGLGRPPVLALTATATERVRETIVGTLGLRRPAVVATSPHRSNLAFDVITCEGDHRLRALVRLTRRLRRPGIVYCATRRETDAVYTLLRRFKVPAYRYHGTISAKDRDREQKRFMRPHHRGVMVATNAFGLGIDKRNIRYILHYQAPSSLEQYVQESGRAGRDGYKASCILLFDPADRSIHEALQARSRVRPEQLYRLARALEAWAGEERSPTLEALSLSAQLGPRITSALLTTLEEAGLVERDDGTIRLTTSPGTLQDDARGLAGKFETLRVQDSRRLDSLAAYAGTTACRATFLRGYFGEDEDEPCGLCDICRDATRTAAFFAPLPVPKEEERPRRRSKGKSHKKGKRSRSRRPARP